MNRLCCTSLLLLLPPAMAQEATPTAPQVRITGRVITADGRPLAGVALAATAGEAMTTAALLQQPATRTGADGSFVLTTMPAAGGAAEIRLHVAQKGMASLARPIAWQLQDGSQLRGVPQQDPEYAAETALGDIALLTGQQLFGRVRDAEGKPLADVLVSARDLLEQMSAFQTGSTSGFLCTARSDASGIFRLPCALSVGAALEFALPGYGRERLQPVAAGTPLEVTLKPTGWAQGRVLRRDGSSIAGATVAVRYELAAEARPVTTGPDGSFRIPLDRPGRWRLDVNCQLDSQRVIEYSQVYTGPRENLEMLLDLPEPEQAEPPLVIRAVARESSQPIARFRAVASWNDAANRNIGYREYRLGQLLRQATPTEDGTAEVAGPGASPARIGTIRVVADGYAPATVTDHEWQPPEGEAEAEPLVVQLDPEATTAGTVRDERTGAPIAGARIRAQRKPRPGESYYPNQPSASTVLTDAAGKFVVRGLGEGDWQLTVEAEGRPPAAITDVSLGLAEQRTDLELAMPTGATVRGRLEGAPRNARVVLAPIQTPTFTAGGNVQYGGRINRNIDRGIAVADDGSFALTGVALANHLLLVRLPSEPRRGGDLLLPIEPFRVRAAGIDRVFDCSEDQPGIMRGHIRFTHADTAFEHLVVTALPVTDDRMPLRFAAYNQRFVGARSFVDRDGTYELRVGPGRYRLVIADLVTGVALHGDEKATELRASQTVERDIDLRLTKVQLQLEADTGIDEPAVVERIELRFVHAAMQDQVAGLRGNEQYDSRTGIHWHPGKTAGAIVLPEGNALFLCRNDIFMLRTDGSKWQNEPLGRGELEVSLESGAAQQCIIKIGASPSIPDVDGSGDEEGEVGADGAAGQDRPPRKG